MTKPRSLPSIASVASRKSELQYAVQQTFNRTGARILDQRAIQPAPAGTSYGPPSFVGVAAQRAGTTRWFSLICDHPDAISAVNRRGRPAKELHFFSSINRSEQNRQRYFSRFPRADGQTVGEWTPRYLVDAAPLLQLAEWCPDVKVLAILRDPLDRLASAQQYSKKRGTEKDLNGFMAAVWRGVYSPQIELLQRTFPADQLLLLQYERCVADPLTELAKTYRFLGLDPGHVPRGVEKVHNASGRSREDVDPIIRKIAEGLYQPDRERLAPLVPADFDFGLWTN